mmetsp:Transcript_32813/g.60022  ORF Transcript_32813/g.60022 Transcript_32813/m.60022 type:complete len:300 (+) Transcript_32813:115-1014(+)
MGTRLSLEEQEWVLGVASPWILLPAAVLCLEALLGSRQPCSFCPTAALTPDPGQEHRGNGVLLAVLLGLHASQLFFSIAIWRAFDVKSMRLQLDRANAGTLTVFYLALAWMRGGIVPFATAGCVVLFVGLYTSTFWTVASTGQYVVQHLAFRWVAYCMSVIVLYKSQQRVAFLLLLGSLASWLCNSCTLVQARQLSMRGQLWPSFLVTCIVTTLAVAATAILAVVVAPLVQQPSEQQAKAFNGDLLSLGVAIGGSLSILVIWLTGEMPDILADRTPGSYAAMGRSEGVEQCSGEKRKPE